MNRREAHRIAYRNIIDGIEGDLANGAEYWHGHPGTGEFLSDEDAAKVEREAKEILAGFERFALQTSQSTLRGEHARKVVR